MNGMKKLIQRLDKYFDLNGDYVEKQLCYLC